MATKWTPLACVSALARDNTVPTGIFLDRIHNFQRTFPLQKGSKNKRDLEWLGFSIFPKGLEGRLHSQWALISKLISAQAHVIISFSTTF